MLKSYLLLSEPFQHKGGLQIELFKGSGATTSLKAYREILLSDAASKHVHKWTKLRVVQHAESYLHEFQVGGRANRSTDFASHAIRLFHDIFKGENHAILFVDVTSAFYMVYRGFFISSDLDSDDDLVNLFRRFIAACSHA